MGWGKGRFTVVSTRNTVYSCVPLLVTVFHRNNCKRTFAPSCVCAVGGGRQHLFSRGSSRLLQKPLVLGGRSNPQVTGRRFSRGELLKENQCPEHGHGSWGSERSPLLFVNCGTEFLFSTCSPQLVGFPASDCLSVSWSFCLHFLRNRRTCFDDLKRNDLVI